MTPADRDEMRRCAVAAVAAGHTTWRAATDAAGGPLPLDGENRLEVACVPSCCFDALEVYRPATAREHECDPLPAANHIAASCPANVIALLDALDQAEKERDEARASLREMAAALRRTLPYVEHHVTGRASLVNEVRDEAACVLAAYRQGDGRADG